MPAAAKKVPIVDAMNMIGARFDQVTALLNRIDVSRLPPAQQFAAAEASAELQRLKGAVDFTLFEAVRDGTEVPPPLQASSISAVKASLRNR